MLKERKNLVKKKNFIVKILQLPYLRHDKMFYIIMNMKNQICPNANVNTVFIIIGVATNNYSNYQFKYFTYLLEKLLKWLNNQLSK